MRKNTSTISFGNVSRAVGSNIHGIWLEAVAELGKRIMETKRKWIDTIGKRNQIVDENYYVHV